MDKHTRNVFIQEKGETYKKSNKIINYPQIIIKAYVSNKS